MRELLDALARDLAGRGVTLPVVVLRLVLSVAAGFLVSRIYAVSAAREGRANRPFATALVLLSILVAMTTMVIDDSIARAFSLVGALAIVRFRTDVEDSRDTAFVIFAVVCGMGSGVANWQVCAVGIPLVGAVAWLGATPPAPAAPSAANPADAPRPTLVVRLDASGASRAAVEGAIPRFATGHTLTRTATARQGAALELTWRLDVRPGADPVALVAELNTVPGVQHAEVDLA